MNLYDDEALKREVIYLHSLWLQGPPNRNPNPTRNPGFDPFPRPRPNYIPPVDLHLSNPPGPIRSHHRPRNPNHPHHPYKRPRPDPGGPDPGREWPTTGTPPSPPAASGWREFKLNPVQKTRPVLAEEQARFAAMKLQRDVLRTCREFFAGKSTDEGDGGGDEAESDHGDEDCSAEFEFFSRLFEEKSELKGYYEKNTGNGEFLCLVCGGTSEKSGRKFKSCLALVQHSLSIHKTNVKYAHRAFAQVICNVLGWDINNPVASSQKDAQSLHSLQVPGVAANVEWPLGWPSRPKKSLEKQVISAEDQASIAALQVQQKASEACKEFFKQKVGSDGESEEEHDDDDDENQSQELKFFLRIFSESDELKSYYKNNYESGDFICLVCAGIGKRVWKSFRDCSGLLQHSTQVRNTKKKRAHRTYARVICEILSWDFDCLPLIVAKGSGTLIGSNANHKNEASSAISEEPLCEDQANTDPQSNGEGCSGPSV